MLRASTGSTEWPGSPRVCHHARSMPGEFVHLHVHSQYSMLDGAIRIERLVQAVKDDGMSAVALTDHGNMYGALQLYKTCKYAGVKPIIGCEVYFTADRNNELP